MKRSIIGLLSALLILAGCATTTKFYKEPTEKNTNIIVGKLSMTAKNFEEMYGYNINGKHTHEVTIVINKPGADEDDQIKMNSLGSAGWFYAAGVEAGEYEVVEFSYLARLGSQRIKFYLPVNERYRMRFKIQTNKVNNLGEFIWISDKRKGNYYDFIRSYDEIKESFMDTFYESTWLEEKWVNVKAY